MTSEFTLEMQLLFLKMIISNSELYPRISNIMNPDNFDKSLRLPAEFIKEYTEVYSEMPDSEQILASTGSQIEKVEEMSDGHIKWFLDNFESFTKRKELERAILKSADLLEKGEFEPVEKLIKDAVQISLQKDLGLDYFADPRGRLMKLKSSNGQSSTGWPSMDDKLYGGFNRGELQIFAGGSGSGKSLFMQNLAVNWLEKGLSGVYITLELSEELCSTRIDSMLTDISSKDIFRRIDDVEMTVKMKGKKYGKLQIKYLPAQSTVNHIRAFCKEYQIKTGHKVDFLCVDYLDLLMPVSVKVSPSDLFIKDKYVSEEIRNLAKELNIIFVTASQLNRSAVEEVEFDHSHISGGISKINTADNVFGIFTSRSMRERGKFQLQLMKTRSSAGVGQKIDLDFNVETLRITDSGNQESYQPSNSNILTKLKPSTKIEIPEQDQKVVADVQATQITQLLNKIRKPSTLI